MKRCLEEYEIEKQLKCKICDVGLCFLGCFKEYHTRARFSYMKRSMKPIYIYMYQADNNKKVVYIEFYSN
jgi:hypothetical protein